jgi:hypothetical protein
VTAAIAVDLVLPYGRRVFGVDPIAAFLGRPLDEALRSVMRGPSTVRREATGLVSEVYPLFLPDGEGDAVPIGAFGELGFANLGGDLVLTVPVVAAREVARQLGDAMIGGPERRATATGTVADLRVRVRAGWRRSFQVGMLGEVAVETPS